MASPTSSTSPAQTPPGTILRSLLRGFDRALRALGVALAWAIRASIRHRRVLGALVVRGAWLVGLWLFVQAGSVLFDARAELDPPTQLVQLATGLALCWITVVFSTSRALRWAAVALGTAHGTLGLVLWSATAG